MRTLIAILALGATVALFGCNNAEPAPEATTTPTTTNAPAMAGKPGGGPEMGSAELQPGMSAAEADARVGSGMKGN